MITDRECVYGFSCIIALNDIQRSVGHISVSINFIEFFNDNLAFVKQISFVNLNVYCIKTFIVVFGNLLACLIDLIFVNC